jgi:putative Mg2+ transporter-C (MgtC) family protein
MPVTVEWSEIFWRLVCTGIASGLIGLNRSEHGRPAGLRTTMLVCFAASISMIQANLLMPTTGKASDSFVVLDLMRLPLGILSGMGFIGAGAILRKGNMVRGVTTAATLWFVTVMGLCFGGGQIALGWTALAIGFVVLRALKRVEKMLGEDLRARLALVMASDGPTDQEVRRRLRDAGFRIAAASLAASMRTQRRKLGYELQWHGKHGSTQVPEVVHDLAGTSGVLMLQWQASGTATDDKTEAPSAGEARGV